MTEHRTLWRCPGNRGFNSPATAQGTLAAFSSTGQSEIVACSCGKYHIVKKAES